MHPNGLIDLLMNLSPAHNVVRSKPAPHALRLQVGIQPVSKRLVFRRVADEARVILNRTPHHRPDVGDELLRHPTPAQKYLRDLPVRLIQAVDANVRGPEVLDGFKASDRAEIDRYKDGAGHTTVGDDGVREACASKNGRS